MTQSAQLPTGQQVAAKPGKVAGVDPFTRLIVLATNDDGTLRVGLADQPTTVWKRVKRHHLVPIDD